MVILFVVGVERRCHGPPSVSRGWTLSQGTNAEALGKVRARGILEIVCFVAKLDVAHDDHRYGAKAPAVNARARVVPPTPVAVSTVARSNRRRRETFAG